MNPSSSFRVIVAVLILATALIGFGASAAVAGSGQQWGIIDTTGTFVIPPDMPNWDAAWKVLRKLNGEPEESTENELEPFPQHRNGGSIKFVEGEHCDELPDLCKYKVIGAQGKELFSGIKRDVDYLNHGRFIRHHDDIAPSIIDESGKTVKEFGAKSRFLYRVNNNRFLIKDADGDELKDSDSASLYDDDGNLIAKLDKLKLQGVFGSLIVVEGDCGYRLLDCSGKLVAELKGVASTGGFSEGLLPAKFSDGKYGYFDSKGELVIPARFTNARSFENGLAEVQLLDPAVETPESRTTDRKHRGFIDRKGNLIVDRVCQVLYPPSEGMVVFCDTTGWGILNKAGKVVTVLPPNCSRVESFHDGLAAVISEPEGTKATFSSWSDKSTVSFIDVNGKTVIPPTSIREFPSVPTAIEFSSGRLRYLESDHLYGYKDSKGNVAIRPQFYSASNFIKGHAIVSITKN